MVGVVGESGGRHDGAEQVESGRNLGVVECVDRWLVAKVISREPRHDAQRSMRKGELIYLARSAAGKGRSDALKGRSLSPRNGEIRRSWLMAGKADCATRQRQFQNGLMPDCDMPSE